MKDFRMPLEQTVIEELALRLDKAERTRTQLPHFSAEHPAMSLDDGYAVSRAWMRHKLASGRHIIGHKIGLTSRAMQRSSNVTEPDFGTLLDDMLFADGQDIPIYVVPAIEIIDARIARIDKNTGATRKVYDTISDNAANAGIVLGGRPVKPDAVDLRWVSALLFRNGVIEESALPQPCSTIRRRASPGSPTSWLLSTRGLSRDRSFWEAASPRRFLRARVTVSTSTMALWVA